jgi:thermitase
MSRLYRLPCPLALLVASFLVSPLAWSAPPASEPPAFSPDTVLVAFQPSTSGAEMSAAHSQAGGRVQRTIPGIGVQVVTVPVGTVFDALQLYRHNPKVRYAEPNYLRPLILPNEGSFSSTLKVFDEQWNLHNHGQSLQTYTDPNTGTPGWQYTRKDADIDAPEAWDIETGDANVWVAVPDSGVDCNHGDLVGKCQHNEDYVTPTEDSFGNPLPELVDQIGHGTHVAGTIAMQTNNGAGGAGVGWHTSIGSFKVCYLEQILPGIPVGSACQDADIATAIDRIVELGYDVINMSFGGPASLVVEEALQRASQAGIVLVAAAGNANNWAKLYPAAYDNVIAVGATNAFDDRAGFSTFSVDDDFDPNTQNDDWVDVLAPGDPILGPAPTTFCSPASSQCFQWMSGTSMAAPHVSGVAALVWSYLRTHDAAHATSTEVRRRIQDCADQTGAMGQNMLVWSKYGRLNAYGALTCGSGDGGGSGSGGDTTDPVISNVTAVQEQGPRFRITWTTDELATSKVEFTCCGVTEDTALVTEHSVSFHGQKNVRYEYYVYSTDAAGNEAMAGPFYHDN